MLVLAEVGAVVDHDVHMAAALQRFAAHPPDVVLFGQVALERNRLDSQFLAFSGRLLQTARMIAGAGLEGPRAEDNVGAFARNRDGDSAADSAARSRNQGYLSFKIHGITFFQTVDPGIVLSNTWAGISKESCPAVVNGNIEGKITLGVPENG